ncbi:MAG: hypothetical protein NC914_04005 [Candidatus Omnitrophica bacterium]|nr:hypothetical protein [Candidatus Omnitrophota bacterium]
MRKLSVILCAILCFSCFSFAQNQDEESMREHYVQGLEYAISGNFQQAEETLQSVISPGHIMFKVLQDARSRKISADLAETIFKGYK